jgi:hypothetical protein
MKREHDMLVHTRTIVAPDDGQPLLVGVRGDAPTSTGVYRFTNPRTGVTHRLTFGIQAWGSVDEGELRSEVTYAVSDEDAFRAERGGRRVAPETQLTPLTQLILSLNHLIDTGDYDDISIDEVYEWIEARSVLPALHARVGSDADLSLYLQDGVYVEWAGFYTARLWQLHSAYAGDHERRWGVRRLGLALLLAWTNEIIQLGSGWHAGRE